MRRPVSNWMARRVNEGAMKQVYRLVFRSCFVFHCHLLWLPIVTNADFTKTNFVYLQKFYQLLINYLQIAVLLEKPPVAQLLENFEAFYGIRSFITVFTRGRHCSISLARSIQSIPPPLISRNVHFYIILPLTSRYSYSPFAETRESS
jgi:hypothetical protein